jgi:tRNA(adenine34) deaminase
VRTVVEPNPAAVLAMRRALELAADAQVSGDVPVGALILDESGSTIAEGANLREGSNDPTAHAEIVAIRAAASARGSWNLEGCTLVVTLEPCVMCAGALLAARISSLVYGAWDDKAGAVGSVYDVVRDRRLPHRVDVTAGVLAEDCAALLEGFFRERR